MSFRRRQTDDLVRAGGSCGIAPSDRTPSSSAVTEEKQPIFLDSAPMYQVSLDRSARLSIERECRSMFVDSRGDMHESGGWLLSHPGQPDRVVMATRPGADAVYGRSNMRLGSDRLRQVQAQLPHLRVSGSWHAHPGDDGVPSAADRQAWAQWRELDNVAFHIGLIATCRSGGWTNLELHGWLVTEEFCERVKVKDL
jgi:proteasome lid subunit RPN8/RPN11